MTAADAENEMEEEECEPEERLVQQTKRYCMAGVLITMFYCVPVAQIIYSYHRRLEDSGNYDMCYFNYLCSHKIGDFHDFNHMFSNVGFILTGLVFMAVVRMREASIVGSVKPRSFSMEEPEAEGVRAKTSWLPTAPRDNSKGVFVHYGLFMATGFTLVIVGSLSAAYHICPNQTNFQFDTAFMYTIGGLHIVTVYHFRHPTYLSASITFLALCIISTATVVGLLWDSWHFRVFFTVTHGLFLLVALTYLHYVGHIRENGRVVTKWRRMVFILRQKWADDFDNQRFVDTSDKWTAEPSVGVIIEVLGGPCRIIFPVLILIVNSAAFVVIWMMMEEANFASQVLFVYVVNSTMYTVYYSAMKWIHGECRSLLWLQPGVYLLLSMSLWAWALWYFGDMVTLWDLISPAGSRARNSECIFLGFFDSHDVWHFLSALALFCTQMSLLTMDDDIIERMKTDIPVF